MPKSWRNHRLRRPVLGGRKHYFRSGLTEGRTSQSPKPICHLRLIQVGSAVHSGANADRGVPPRWNPVHPYLQLAKQQWRELVKITPPREPFVSGAWRGVKGVLDACGIQHRAKRTD